MERIIAWWLHKHEMCCQAAVWRLHLASEMIDAVSVCDLGNNFFFFLLTQPMCRTSAQPEQLNRY